jgi:ABC-type polysaccharide/polyol phosphate transport system ATPase subunit
LGAGFHPDMTGRENAILYGTILGHSSRKMEKRVSDIAEWADLGKFIDLPIRTYSSGMIGRLSFAVATDQAPEIFIVDEVLSVGDAEFQIKSTIEKMASKAILLDRGRLLGAGLPADVIVKYRALIAS